uniref:DSP-PTPase phosphatase fused to NAD+ Kinase domain-containing protein n=1 Tax=Schlesneria paludicola TaxID=360056 RepID=A0A7C4QNX8_9PLAN
MGVDRHRRMFALLGVAFLAALGGLAVWRHHRYKHFAVHEAGRVYRSAWVEADVMAELVRRYGIRTVVNLCRPGEMGPTRAVEERVAVESAGARLLELPLPDTADPHDPRLAPHIAALSNPENYPLLIHCQHGVNRTARTLAMYEVLVKQQDGEAAIRRMPGFGRPYNPLEYEFARNFTRAFRFSADARRFSGDIAQQQHPRMAERHTVDP